MKYLIFDTETTGLPLHRKVSLEKQPRVIEFAGIVTDGGKEVSSHTWLINPGMALDPKITEITGIKDEDLVGKPDFKTLEPEISALIKSVDGVVAHNLPFDTRMIKMEYQRIGLEVRWPKTRICTVQEHTEIFGYRPKLTQLYQFYIGEPLKQTHRALDDVRALLEICLHAEVL